MKQEPEDEDDCYMEQGKAVSSQGHGTRRRSHARSLRAMANPSAVWGHFDLCTNDPLRAQCRLCGSVVVRGGANPRQCGTTNLHRHLRVHHGGRLIGRRYHVMQSTTSSNPPAKSMKVTNPSVLRTQVRNIAPTPTTQQQTPPKTLVLKTIPLKVKQVAPTTIKMPPKAPTTRVPQNVVPQQPAEVVVIVGVIGGCRAGDLCNMLITDVRDLDGSVLKVTMPRAKIPTNRTFLVEGEYYKIMKRYMNLRPKNVPTTRFFLNYQNGKCLRQVIGKNKIAKMPKQIAEFLELPDASEYTGHSIRRTPAPVLLDADPETAIVSEPQPPPPPPEPVRHSMRIKRTIPKWIEEFSDSDRDPLSDNDEELEVTHVQQLPGNQKDGGGQKKVCLRWNSYHSNMQNSFPTLLDSEEFVDVTLACEGKSVKCHKIILSSCSDYLAQLLRENPCPHPIILMKDLKFWEVEALVKFMYRGEVNVAHDKLPQLLNAAEALQVKGLAGPIPSQVQKPPMLIPQTKARPSTPQKSSEPKEQRTQHGNSSSSHSSPKRGTKRPGDSKESRPPPKIRPQRSKSPVQERIESPLIKLEPLDLPLSPADIFPDNNDDNSITNYDNLMTMHDDDDPGGDDRPDSTDCDIQFELHGNNDANDADEQMEFVPTDFLEQEQDIIDEADHDSSRSSIIEIRDTDTRHGETDDNVRHDDHNEKSSKKDKT